MLFQNLSELVAWVLNSKNPDDTANSFCNFSCVHDNLVSFVNLLSFVKFLCIVRNTKLIRNTTKDYETCLYVLWLVLISNKNISKIFWRFKFKVHYMSYTVIRIRSILCNKKIVTSEEKVKLNSNVCLHFNSSIK